MTHKYLTKATKKENFIVDHTSKVLSVTLEELSQQETETVTHIAHEVRKKRDRKLELISLLSTSSI